MWGETHYEIEQVLYSRVHRGKLQYLVQWKQYPLTEASWVSSVHIQEGQLIKKFYKEHPQNQGGGIWEVGCDDLSPYVLTDSASCLPGAALVKGSSLSDPEAPGFAIPGKGQSSGDGGVGGCSGVPTNI